MKTRWKILIGAGIFMVLAMMSAWVTAHHRPEGEVEDYKNLLRAQGEQLEISEVLAPPMPAESNSLNAVEDAFRMFGPTEVKVPNAMKMVAAGKAMTGWMQPEARGYDFTNSWDDFSAEVAADRPAMELLHEVLERPVLDFQLDYKKGAKLPLPQLSQLRHATQRLEAAVIVDLHNGDTGPAATNIATMLALVQKNASEGLLISHLVRIARTAIAIGPTWEFLQATNVTDAQLAIVQQAWAQMDFLSDATNTFVEERDWVMERIEESRASHEGYEDIFGPAGMGSSGGSSGGPGLPFDLEAMTEKPRQAVAEVMWRSSWSYTAEERKLKGDQIIIGTLRAMQTNQSQCYKSNYDAMMTGLAALGTTNAGEAFFRLLDIPDRRNELGNNYGNVVQKTIKTVTACRVVVAATALKRFQLKHGKWPDTLGELTPDFLRTVPIDPFDGQPLRYHPNADGTYLLYSVGEDGKDDGGDASGTLSGYSRFLWQDDHARDWVWPQPATAAEMQFFYDNPPK